MTFFVYIEILLKNIYLLKENANFINFETKI